MFDHLCDWVSRKLLVAVKIATVGAQERTWQDSDLKPEIGLIFEIRIGFDTEIRKSG